MPDDDVSQWLRQLANGDKDAAQALSEEYSEKLVRLARSQLEGLPCRVADEEDVALSAVTSLSEAWAPVAIHG